MIKKEELNKLSKEEIVSIVCKFINDRFTTSYLLENDIKKHISKKEIEETDRKIKESEKAFDNYEKYQQKYMDYLHELLEKYNVPINEKGEFLWKDLLPKASLEEVEKLNSFANEYQKWWDLSLKF